MKNFFKTNVSSILVLVLTLTLAGCANEAVTSTSSDDTSQAGNATISESKNVSTIEVTTANTSKVNDKSDDVIKLNGNKLVIKDNESGKYGIKNDETDIAVDYIYDDFKKFSNELFAGYKNHGKEVYLLNKNGEHFTELTFETISYTSDSNFSTTLDGFNYLLKIEKDKLIIDSVSTEKELLGHKGTVNIGIVDNKIDMIGDAMLLTEQANTILTDLGRNYDEAVKKIEKGSNDFIKQMFGGEKKLQSIMQINVVTDGDSIFVVAYAMFDDTDSKREIAVEFRKSDNGEYIIDDVKSGS